MTFGLCEAVTMTPAHRKRFEANATYGVGQIPSVVNIGLAIRCRCLGLDNLISDKYNEIQIGEKVQQNMMTTSIRLIRTKPFYLILIT